ncbi:MAG: (d)CMP kinase [Faecalicoccus sp.]|nr:(d)CMP kinase [Faecalicoccus sp.]
MKKFNVAIDGPSGVGKSTIAKAVAEKYGMVHLDTGAMYRCVAYYLKNNPVNLDDDKALKEKLDEIHIRFDGKEVYLNDVNVSKEIRDNEISMYASKTSSYPLVREKLVALQQQITADKGYIVDGRDICSVVLPNAEVKIYMDASADARAQRRYKEYLSKNVDVKYEDILRDIKQRDYQDMHREISPLVRTEDAAYIDTSELNIDQVIEAVDNVIKSKI